MKQLLIIVCFLTLTSEQALSNNTGITMELFKGSINLSGGESTQYGLRLGYWPLSWFDFGFEGIVANNVGGYSNYDIYRYHLFAGLHLRFFKYINPYIIGTFGKGKEPKSMLYVYDENLNIFNKYYTSFSEMYNSTLKVGIALEVYKLRLALETGGGSMESGHVETNFSISCILKQLPNPNPLSDFTITFGAHHFNAFAGPYKGVPLSDYTGFDFTLEFEKNDRIREYNAGIFFTDYIFHTGVFNLGTAWRLKGINKILTYIDITPGVQFLIWAEPDPDFILPAASLGLGAEYKIWKFVPFIKTRTLATYSSAKSLVLGTTYTMGIGISF